MYSCDQSCIFSIIRPTPVFSVTEIILICWWNILFRIHWWKQFKRTVFIWKL